MERRTEILSFANSANNPAPDAELVRAARRGDKRAFVEIVAHHQAMVTGIALGILKDFAASEDAAQEAFLTAWRKIHDLQEPHRLRGWLGQIARNAALGYLRRQHGGETLDQCAELADDAPAPDAIAASEEEAALVREALEKLPENYRLPIILYYREGQSVRAVAESLSISEDAVKQRLARGREMLRDRVAGVIETVLKKTSPSPVFTMTIAVAIGALTAPTIIAGTVFSAAAATTLATTTTTTAASASATTSVSSTTSVIVNFMSTTKGLVATAAFVTVLCIPVGYQLAPHSEAKPTPARAAISSSEKLVRPTPNFDHSPLFVEWRRLHEIHGTNAAAMPALYKAITEIQDPFRRRAFRAAQISEWVQVDPEGGLAFFISNKDNAQRKQFFEEWLGVNPRAAVDALLAHPGYERLAQQCLMEIARKVPERVLQIVNDIPKPDSYWDTSIRDAVALVAEGNLSATRAIVEKMSSPNRGHALAGVARAWGKSDLDGAIKWAKGLQPSGDEDFDPNDIVRAAVYGKATLDPFAALDQVGVVPPGGRSGYFADTTGAKILREASVADFDATVRWLVSNPGRLSHEDLMGMAEPVTDRLNADPTSFLNQLQTEGSLAALLPAINSALLNDSAGQRTAVWDWLATQPETPETKQLRREVLNSAAYQEPELALKLAKDLPNSTADQRQELARALYNGGNMLHRFDKLMQDAPANMREPLLQAAFENIGSENMGDPHLWIERLAQMPESQRDSGMRSIARAWAGKSPEEAIGWLATQPPTDSRTQALGEAVQAWAHKDPSSAANYITALPHGTERDRGTHSLVQALGERHPHEAWQWAQAITDESLRKSALSSVIARTIDRDPRTARHWLETEPLSPEIKAQFEARLNAIPTATRTE
jgi:RNA polymerase sigma factor (sigma-70 family)